ncbi:MAG: phosphonoacetaldehyde reductase [Tissierellia bacterium]|nr:phosphonoacetaldehyde reductase [Bacillota bacterium]NLL23103.1 phosphonoacetaldehyde reductase [Tissierellia bacterium]
MQETYYDFSAFELLKDKKPLLVCDDAFDSFNIKLPCEVIRFSDFTPNPVYEDIQSGVDVLKKNGCDFIVAIGGGSSIDTAKGIKFFHQTDLPVMAVPTTSGTGSEATHFAAIYKNGEKRSISDEKLLPEYVVLRADMLKTLPIYQKKCTMLDALCQAIESWWSKKATKKSIIYSKTAIALIVANMESYLKNDDDGNEKMLYASHIAGKAINITTTTAPHAMSYKLTALYGLPHGHAVAICLPKVWRQTKNYNNIADALGKKNHKDAVLFFEEMLLKLDILPPQNAKADDVDLLTDSVDPQRLSNHPVPLDRDTIKKMYREILGV